MNKYDALVFNFILDVSLSIRHGGERPPDLRFFHVASIECSQENHARKARHCPNSHLRAGQV